MQNTRMARLAGELQQEIATIILQEVKDPGIGFVTVTRVELSKDIRRAKVFFSTRRYTPDLRAFARNAVMCATVMPAYCASTMACASTS